MTRHTLYLLLCGIFELEDAGGMLLLTPRYSVWMRRLVSNLWHCSVMRYSKFYYLCWQTDCSSCTCTCARVAVTVPCGPVRCDTMFATLHHAATVRRSRCSYISKYSIYVDRCPRVYMHMLAGTSLTTPSSTPNAIARTLPLLRATT